MSTAIEMKAKKQSPASLLFSKGVPYPEDRSSTITYRVIRKVSTSSMRELLLVNGLWFAFALDDGTFPLQALPLAISHQASVVINDMTSLSRNF